MLASVMPARPEWYNAEDSWNYGGLRPFSDDDNSIGLRGCGDRSRDRLLGSLGRAGACDVRRRRGTAGI